MYGGATALLGDGVAKGAATGNYLPGLGLMLIIMASETAQRDHVTDIIRICVPTGFHFREEILLV